jgi:hypothetical protein
MNHPFFSWLNSYFWLESLGFTMHHRSCPEGHRGIRLSELWDFYDPKAEWLEKQRPRSADVGGGWRFAGDRFCTYCIYMCYYICIIYIIIIVIIIITTTILIIK